MTLFTKVAAVAAAMLLSFAATAQEYPNKPIRMVVPFGAGGPTDVMARWVADGISKRVGQTVVVENKAGAAGRIGLEHLATQPNDGYTIGFVASTLPFVEAFYKDWKRDVATSYSYVGSVVDNPGTYLWGAPNLPGNSLVETLAYFKANPGKINIGYTAPGVWELVYEHLNKKHGLDMTRIAYKGTAEAKLALQSGDIHILADGAAGHLQEWRAGKEKALVFIGTKRAADTPEIPALSETGTSDFLFDSTTNFGVIGPAGMPAETVNKLNRAINDLLKDPEFLAKSKLFGSPAPRTPAELRNFIIGQRDLAVKLVKEYKIPQQ